MLENTRFETDFRKPRVNKFRLWHVPINSDELSFKVGPSLFEFKPCVSDRSWKRMV